jgi:hypothetical protein
MLEARLSKPGRQSPGFRNRCSLILAVEIGKRMQAKQAAEQQHLT